jgi:phosphoglucosamine mutase
MGRLFGTDGVRGVANRDLTVQLALELGAAAAHVLAEAGAFAGHRPIAVLGRDPRASGEMLAAAVAAGLASTGVDVYDVGVLPTPAVAFLTADLRADLGVVVSASHNPMPDNGIKFFARGGHKLPDAVEDEVAARLGEPWEGPTGAGVGRLRRYDEGAERYVAHLLGTLPPAPGRPGPLAGLRVVVDCAHGAAWQVAPLALTRAGARVVTIGGAPDGWNINDGYGSTHPQRLAEAVVAHRADVGIAHDGDADRCLALDSTGQLVDGDQIMAILALALHEQGRLRHDTVVATVMSNLALTLALEQFGIDVVRTAVGDRYVLEAMRAGDYSLGGEQSGHVVLADHATTGDGILTALQLLARVATTGRPLAELAGVVRPLPQVLVNVGNVARDGLGHAPGIDAAVRAAENRLGHTGRVLLRPSGTEPVVRVMVEAERIEVARQVADELAGVVRSELALPAPAGA